MLIIAFPDTYVTATNTFYDSFFKQLNINKNNKYKAGHAAVVLINPENKQLEYYDFGRYITPEGFGRIRSTETDPEIILPIKAEFDKNGNLINEEDIFTYLSNSKWTHGEGRMIISHLKHIDYPKAKKFVEQEQAKGLISYGPFTFGGSNCSRFVADVILKGTTHHLTYLKTFFPMTLTPSPLGNTWNGRKNGIVWEIENNEIRPYATTRLTVWRELICNFLVHKNPPSGNTIGTLQEPNRPIHLPTNAQWLSGIGAGAWFVLSKKDNNYQIERFDAFGETDFCFLFSVENSTFDENIPYQFSYPSHAKSCCIKQNHHLYTFKKIS